MLRFTGIGILHAVLYLYIVPFVIHPKFGSNGFIFIIFTATTISIAVLGTILWEKKIKGDHNERY